MATSTSSPVREEHGETHQKVIQSAKQNTSAEGKMTQLAYAWTLGSIPSLSDTTAVH